jgi:hypothetical protein
LQHTWGGRSVHKMHYYIQIAKRGTLKNLSGLET